MQIHQETFTNESTNLNSCIRFKWIKQDFYFNSLETKLVRVSEILKLLMK